MENIKIFIYLFIVISLTGVYGQDTFRDDFATATYNSNDGSNNFSSDWVEVGETTNSLNGRIQTRVNSNNRALRFTNLDEVSISRSLDLSAYVNVTLELDYERTNGNESIDVQLFDGTSYVTVANLNGTGSILYNLNNNFIRADAGIRFISGSGQWNNTNERIFIDNVLFTAEVANEPSIVTGSGNQIYCPGDAAISVAQSISIVDPDDTETTAVYIQISSGYIENEDMLTLTGTHPNITSSWNPVEGELTLESNSGTTLYSEFEAAILATKFSPSATNPFGVRQFSITVGEANFLPSTGHYYEFVASSGISWTDAKTQAENRTYFGLQGYLVTLTSQEEAEFSGSQAQGVGWIGASDAAVEGEWRWETGPEAGTQFWNGGIGGTELTFAFWNTNEPNNCCSGEDYAHITDNSIGVIGSWNDLPNAGGAGPYASQGYVIEYGGMSGDPTLSLTAITMITVSTCTVITNRRITYRVKND